MKVVMPNLPQGQSDLQPDGQPSKATKDRTCILVLGMHRSGTSALTRVLSLLGAALPQNILGAGEGNETGHWEPERLVHLHDQMLAEAGSSWDDWRRLNLQAQLPAERLDRYKSEIRRLIDEEYVDAPLFVLKEPRICRFVPLYLEILAAMDVAVRPVLVFRHPLEVAASLAARNEMAPAQSHLYWLRHVLDAERATRDLPRSVASYAALLGDWRSAIAPFESELGLVWPHEVEDVAAGVDGFLSPAHRHHAADEAALAAAPIVSDWVRRAHAAVNKLRGDPETAMAELDAIGSEFDAATDLFGASLAAERGVRDRALAAQQHAFAGSLAAVQAERDARGAEVERVCGELAAAQAELVHQEQVAAKQREEFAASLASAYAERDARAAEAEQVRGELAAERQQRADEVAALRQQVDTERAESRALADRLNAQIETAEQRIAEMNVEVNRLRAAAVEAEAAVAAAQAERDAAKAEFERLRGELEAERTLLAAVLEETKIRERILTSEIGGLDNQLQHLMHERDNLIAALGSQTNATSDQLAELRWVYETSTSWRLTEPLRRLAEANWIRPLLSIRKRGFRNISHVLFEQPNCASGLLMQQQAARRRDCLFSNWHRTIHSLHRNNFSDLPEITISVVVYNSEKWISGFAESLVGQIYPLSKIHVHFVDNSSKDDTPRVLSELERQIGKKFLSFKISKRPNLGFGMGNDFAIRQAGTDFVLVTNVDLEFFPDSIVRAVVVALSDDKDVACWELRQAPFEHPKYYDPVSLETAWCSHACVLMRRDSYVKVGGYEPRIFMYGEDVEISYRFRDQGLRLRYVPWATVIHHVDLDDTTLRPHQLSGSLAANVLIRYRFGIGSEGQLAHAVLRLLHWRENDPKRKSAMARALKLVQQNKRRFLPLNSSKTPTHHPFMGFDYVTRRDGHDVKQIPPMPNESLPLVSIITRTHGPKIGYLREAIASVLNQTYPNIEHIIVEDRTAEAAGLVEEVRDAYRANIRYLISDGVGRSRAGNCGLDAARGQYLMFLDNDDLLYPDHVEILISALRANRDAVASYSLAWEVLTDDGSKQESFDYLEHLHLLPDSHRRPYSHERLQVENFIPIQSILFSRALFERFGGIEEDLEYLEDWNLWVRYSHGGKFVMVPKLTSVYRTPADPEKRAARHQKLHAAYDTVCARNQAAVRNARLSTALVASAGFSREPIE